MKQLTVIILLIRPDLIERCLETLYKNTADFYCYVLDQTKHGIDMGLRDKYPNLMIIRSPRTDTHYTGNLGFSMGSNLLSKLVETPYFMLLNDDVEMIHPAWFDGVLESFEMIDKATPNRPAVCVNLASTRLADWSVGRDKGDHFDIIPYKESYTDEDWNFLVNESHYINEHLTIQPRSVFDGVTLYASVIKTDLFRKIGGLDNRYMPGSGEDYDWSCISSMWGYRSVCTTLSWCFHHWSKSFESLQESEDIQSLQIPELNWNHNHEKWGERFDIWGVKCKTCNEILLTKDGKTAFCPNGHESYIVPQNTQTPL